MILGNKNKNIKHFFLNIHYLLYRILGFEKNTLYPKNINLIYPYCLFVKRGGHGSIHTTLKKSIKNKFFMHYYIHPFMQIKIYFHHSFILIHPFIQIKNIFSSFIHSHDVEKKRFHVFIHSLRTSYTHTYFIESILI